MPVGRKTRSAQPTHGAFREITVLEAATGKHNALFSYTSCHGHKRINKGMVKFCGYLPNRDALAQVSEYPA